MERILILFSNRENQRLLAHVLMPKYEVVFDFPALEDDPEKHVEIDLCILDGSSLKKYARQLAAERLLQDPVLMPVLLLSDRRAMTLMTADYWKVVDDVVLRPLEKWEMRARVESLVKARRLSLQLRTISTAYQHERRVAQRFQEAALPRGLPKAPGLIFSSFYRPGMDEAQIGGDWYDALLLADGRVMVSIGDVCGSGLDAAVAMANVRQVVRGVAHVNADPAMLLDAADRTLRSENPEALVTAFVGIFDPITSLLSYASAGHPRPLLRTPDGNVRELFSDGAPLGLPFRVDRSLESVAIPVGSLLVLYTDGLTEATRDPLEGEDALRSVIEKNGLGESPNAALAIHDSVLSNGARDDIAVLTMRRVERTAAEGRLRQWSFDSTDAQISRSVRLDFLAELEAGGIRGEALAAAELVFSELLGNVVTYAPAAIDITLDLSGELPVLHVLDKGPGFQHLPNLPEDDFSERGRGLFIVSRFVAEFHVARRPEGGSHARAVLLRATA